MSIPAVPMSTNIDDIRDPVLYGSGTVDPVLYGNINDSHHEAKEEFTETNNVSSPDVKIKEKSKDDDFELFSESNIVLLCIIVLAGFPQSNKFISSLLPLNLHNDIIINVIKAIIMFIMYKVIMYLLK